MEGVKQAIFDFAVAMTPRVPAQLEQAKSCICSNPLLNRVTSSWKLILMDSSTIIAISCVFLTFINGATIYCAIFTILAISSGVSAFYMRRFDELRDLEDTAKGLRQTKERFEALATNLERENNRLSETNRELLRTNDAFRSTNRELQTTNEAFRVTNTQLTQQVTSLTLQVSQLRESAERIRGEVLRFQSENSHLHTNVEGFDRSMQALDLQILNSRSLCDQISNRLSSQQEGLGQQLTQLGQYLAELGTQGTVHQRIQELGLLHQQVQQAATQLGDLQVQYAQERGRFETIHGALVQLKNEFDTAMRAAVSNVNSAASNITSNNQQFLSGLQAEHQRIQQLLNHYFPGVPQSPPSNSFPILTTNQSILVH